MISFYLRKLSRNRLALIAGVGAVATFSVAPAFAQGGAGSGLASSITQINTTMTALQGIAETGVAIVVVPFGIGFALKIAGHVLRAGT